MNTNVAIVPHVVAYYDRDLLIQAMPHLVHTWFGQVRDIPQKASATIKFRRYSLLTAATTPLTDGQTPAGSSLAVTDLSAVAAQYGDFITLTDQLETETEDPIILEMNKLLGQQAGNTFDQLCRDILVTGSTVQFASTAVSRVTVGSTMKLTATEVRKAVKTMKGNNAMKITQMIEPTTGIDTIPVNSCYVAIIHPNTTFDLKSDTAFVPVENYPSQQNVMPGEVGKIDEIRFIETTNAKVFAGAGVGGLVDVYATIVLGAEAYGITRIAGKALQTITHPIGTSGTADPLDQRSTHGWKGYFVTKILNDQFMMRIEHAVSS